MYVWGSVLERHSFISGNVMMSVLEDMMYINRSWNYKEVWLFLQIHESILTLLPPSHERKTWTFHMKIVTVKHNLMVKSNLIASNVFFIPEKQIVKPFYSKCAFGCFSENSIIIIFALTAFFYLFFFFLIHFNFAVNVYRESNICNCGYKSGLSMIFNRIWNTETCNCEHFNRCVVEARLPNSPPKQMTKLLKIKSFFAVCFCAGQVTEKKIEMC